MYNKIFQWELRSNIIEGGRVFMWTPRFISYLHEWSNKPEIRYNKYKLKLGRWHEISNKRLILENAVTKSRCL